MKRQEYFSKERTRKNKNPERVLSTLHDKEFRVTIIRMLIEFGRRIEQLRENFKKELEYIIKN